MNTIFWILLMTWSFMMSNTQLQWIIDNNTWLYVNDIMWSTWCDWSRLIAWHNFKKLWKQIMKLNVWDVVKFDWCTYKMKSYNFYSITWTKNDIFKKSNRLFFQTCADDTWKTAFIAEFVLQKTRKITWFIKS